MVRPSFWSLSRSERSRRGFTLIELVVVLMILAAIAGLVIPQVGMLGRTTDMAASAKTQADLASNLQLYFVLQKRFPQGLDSLLDTTGAIYATDNADANLQTRGLPKSGSGGVELSTALVPGELTNATNAEYLRSLSRAGLEFVYDHDTTVINSNNSSAATTARALTGTFDVAELTETSSATLVARLVPQGIDETRERVVAFGVGPRNAAIGKTLTNAPIYPGNDGRYYGRYIAYFKIFASGERATLIGVTDCYGRAPDYTQQQFNESLPDGSRQG